MLSWFQGLGPIERQTPREDRYLVFPRVAGATGVKLREGRLEIKVRRGEPEPVALGGEGGIRGRRDIWLKWFSTAGVGEALAREIADADGQWTRVQKDRCIAVFESDGASCRAIPPQRRVQSGCLLELTDVRVAGTSWWTLGLEAFGPDSKVIAIVDLVAKAAFAQAPPAGVLADGDSLSYSAWLDLNQAAWARGSAQQQQRAGPS